jgi:hypothetical protein
MPEVGVQRRQQLDNVLADQRGLGPFEPTSGAVAIADRVVALDAAHA